MRRGRTAAGGRGFTASYQGTTLIVPSNRGTGFQPVKCSGGTGFQPVNRRSRFSGCRWPQCSPRARRRDLSPHASRIGVDSGYGALERPQLHGFRRPQEGVTSSTWGRLHLSAGLLIFERSPHFSRIIPLFPTTCRAPFRTPLCRRANRWAKEESNVRISSQEARL